MSIGPCSYTHLPALDNIQGLKNKVLNLVKTKLNKILGKSDEKPAEATATEGAAPTEAAPEAAVAADAPAAEAAPGMLFWPC